jgi:hypothetical protein
MKIDEETRAFQHGPFVVITKPAKKGGSITENVIIEVHDARSGASLWTKTFPKEAPQVWISPLKNRDEERPSGSKERDALAACCFSLSGRLLFLPIHSI